MKPQATFRLSIVCPDCGDESAWTGSIGDAACERCGETFSVPLAEFRLFAMREDRRSNPDGVVLERFAGPFGDRDGLDRYCRLNDCFPGVEAAFPMSR